MKIDIYKLLYVMLIGDQENTKKKTDMKLQKRRTKKDENFFLSQRAKFGSNIVHKTIRYFKFEFNAANVVL